MTIQEPFFPGFGRFFTAKAKPDLAQKKGVKRRIPTQNAVPSPPLLIFALDLVLSIRPSFSFNLQKKRPL